MELIDNVLNLKTVKSRKCDLSYSFPMILIYSIYCAIECKLISNYNYLID